MVVNLLSMTPENVLQQIQLDATVRNNICATRLQSSLAASLVQNNNNNQ
jgi:hypothetical protein